MNSLFAAFINRNNTLECFRVWTIGWILLHLQIILSNTVAGRVDLFIQNLLLWWLAIGISIYRFSFNTVVCYNKCDDSSSSDWHNEAHCKCYNNNCYTGLCIWSTVIWLIIASSIIIWSWNLHIYMCKYMYVYKRRSPRIHTLAS